MLNTKSIVFFFSLSLILFSCKKEPGVGGHSSISGHLTIRHYNANFNQFLGTYDGADQYVYIVYGNHSGYDQRLKTDYNGDFEFQYLYPGEYTVYAYSLDSTLQSISGQVPVIQNVDLGKKEDLVLPDMIIFN
jgi:hypothetical protein